MKDNLLMLEDDYFEKIFLCWEKFTAEECGAEEIAGDVRPVILESWKRSREYGIRPDGASTTVIRQAELDNLLNANKDLIDVASPYMDNLYQFIKGTNFVIHLTDRNGCILKHLADDEQIRHKMKDISYLQIGSVRNERIAGTDSTSLCIAIDQPIQVIAAEHYRSENHGLFCSSAPIHDPSGYLCGVLTVTGPREYYQPHTLGMVSAAADGIEKGIRMQEAYQLSENNRNILSATINTLDSGIIILDSFLRILTANKNAVRMLNMPTANSYEGSDIFKYISKESLPAKLQALDQEAVDRQLTLVTSTGAPIDLCLSILPIRSGGMWKNTILSFYDQKRMRRLTRSISGYNASYTFSSFIGHSEAIESVKKNGAIAASSSSNLLVCGESGTGKELVAQSVHNGGPRANEPFVAINCGSIPRNLIESELFGYESGAFTGANKEGQPGKFELANGGTLFLDEIGDMPIELQASLLRVLQTHEVTRIGGKHPRKVDVRLIAATNVDLAEAIRQKKFRQDLYYRLNVLYIYIEPLRRRKDDILLLAEHFVSVYNTSLGKNVKYISKSARQILLQYSWPGNVRELENTIERGINLVEGDTLTPSELPDTIIQSTTFPYPGGGQPSAAAPAYAGYAPAGSYYPAPTGGYYPTPNEGYYSAPAGGYYPHSVSPYPTDGSAPAASAPASEPYPAYGGPAAPAGYAHPNMESGAAAGSMHYTAGSFAPADNAEVYSPQIHEREKILQALQREKGHVQSVSKSLNMPVSTLYKKMKKYKINPKDFKQW